MADGSEISLGSGYVLMDEIGAGGMGTVWRARHRDSGEVVAVKLLRDGLSADQDLVLRFVQERQVMRSLRHPNIVTIRDFVVEGERLALVMDLVEGGDLRTLVQRRGTLPPAEAAGLLAQTAGALAAAHDLGIVHRDVKPGNVLLDRATGQVRLTDFGVARILHGPGLTQTSAVIGTPVYMAPEVADGGAATPAVDVYALGLILYELLAGRPPFVGDHPMVLIRQHAMAVPRRLPGMPDALWALVSACAAKDPAARPPAGAVAAALRDAGPALAGLPALPAVSRSDAPSVTSEPLAPSPLPPGAPPATGPAQPAATTGPAGPAGPGRPHAPSEPSPGPGAPGPGGPAGRSRRRVVVLGAVTVALAAAVTAVAVVAPWRAPASGTPHGPASRQPLAVQSLPVGTTPHSAVSTPGTGKSGEPKKGETHPVRDRTTVPAERQSTEPKKKTADKPETGLTKPSERVRSPEPDDSRTTTEVKPDDGTKRTDPTRLGTTPEWQCRPWVSAGPGTSALMSPCIAVVGDTIFMKGKLKKAAGDWNIHVQLYNTEAEHVASQTFICKDVSPAANGVAMCGPFKVAASRVGQLHDVRQRWRPTGALVWGGGRESPTVTW
ncbi:MULTISPECIES: protein kinase [unclassified Nonomuraea]|uniref:serine/threonine-protein kinase n=1 Tax=unclassified Nonomuraea TaxID=2593643 RepID=UPI0033F71772